MIENYIPTIATAATTIITSIIAILCNKSKNKKDKLVELAKIAQKLPGYICEAENIFGKGTGIAKNAYVLNKIQIDCISKKIEYKEDEWKAEIEKTLTTPQKKIKTEEIEK